MRGVVEFPMTFVARLYSSACTPSTAWPYLKLYCRPIQLYSASVGATVERTNVLTMSLTQPKHTNL